MILSVLKLMRLYYGLPFSAGFIVILFYLTGGLMQPVWGKALPAFLSLVGVISGGYLLNDVCDVEVDKINAPRRILAAGTLPQKTALIGSIAMFALGLAMGGFCGLPFFLAITAIAGLLIFYDLFSKRLGVFKDVVIAVLMTSLYPLALTVAEPVHTPRLNVLFIHPVWLFLSVLGYEMLKDIRDVKGDREINRKGFNYGEDKRFLLMARVFILAGSLITLLPYIFGYGQHLYGAASIAAIALAIVSTLNKPVIAVRYIYVSITLITAGSMVDLLVFGP